MTPRSVRNNNPGNLNAGAHWHGLMARADMTAEQAAEPRFAVFKTPMWGFRALAIVLLNYERLHGLHTIDGIINRWAPSEENNTAAYVYAVARALGVGIDDSIDVADQHILAMLCQAISVHEAGKWFFTNADLDAGVEAALAG